ncbi:unnamed protein product (macronuclear) [Paramecium tetraurelia]|uniref:non-specific serine/threonine protein kinase n=1 Tax=Paramecium tetraurelia TaxID=5888 RepID=A0DV61_PARTE|nr:uncharacterized protein GSPATT00020591001 [Paramecium tetraurelia]CAK86928.1 unnamed protein product [Paramecium tetraurelia]|eukprot:XP_001454325.1 hypothetical protein (macronuclear) [Paramecium tetraurelia strain d4-2]
MSLQGWSQIFLVCFFILLMLLNQLLINSQWKRKDINKCRTIFYVNLFVQQERTLGQGTFGKVKLGYHTIADEYVAIKILEKSRIENQCDLIRVQREISILRKVCHSNVIKLYEILESESCVYLVMEYVKGGELYEYIIKKKYLPEHIAVRYFQQLVFATEYLHSQNITHRDLKPENLLLDENRQLKIADFGLSFISQTKGEYLKTACGSPCYAAPEMLVGKTYEGTKSDIWSCGIILFAMLCGYLPFEHENTQQLYELIKNSDFEKPEHLSKNAQDMLTKILVKDPTRRYNFEQIKQHPFFQLHASIPTKNLSLNDQNVIQKMIEMGYQQNQIIVQLQSNKHNTLTTIYFLLQKKYNSTHRQSFFQNIQNIGNLKLDINQKRFTLAKFQPSQQGSPLLDKIDKIKKSIRSRLDNSPYLKTQISQRFKKVNLSVQSKRVSIQIENQRQKTNSVQEKHYDYPCIFTSNNSDQKQQQQIEQTKSRIQSRKNSKNQAPYKILQRRNIEQAIKTDFNEEYQSNQKAIYAQVRQRNKTQPHKSEEGQKYFDKGTKLNTSHQMVEKTPQHSPYINMNFSNHRQLFKQIYNGNLQDYMKKKKDLKTQKLMNDQP